MQAFFSQNGFAFDRPGYLALLALIPLLWWIGQRSLAALGPWRKGAALVFRSVVVALVVFALADVQYKRSGEGLTVVYVLDQSLSIPAPQRQAMLDYVKTSVHEHRSDAEGDRYAVIAFGRDAAVEVPPVRVEGALGRQIESVLDPEYTDLASAIQRARAIFPPDAAGRIVVVSDGNQNVGDAYREARAAAAVGVSIDVVPIYLRARGEVSVEKVDVPAGVRRGQPFDIRVVTNNDALTLPSGAAAPPVEGRLVVMRKAGQDVEVVADQEVKVEAGKQVFTIAQELDAPDFYTYEARFEPRDAGVDGAPQNNVATAFTELRGKGRVLLIENVDEQGQASHLVERLRAAGLEVTATVTDQLFSSLAELQRYDAVVLVDVARSSADSDNTASFSDAQIEMLVRNTREMGCGLVMIGGPNTFGAGGWANTKLEEAMPVDFQIKAAEVVPVGALALVIDHSGSMTGEKLEMSKAAAVAAIRAMGRRDFISVTAFDSATYPVVPLRRVGDYQAAARRVELISAGGGTDMYPGMVQGFDELRRAAAGVKHMIVLTDGLTPEAKFDSLVRKMRDAKISVTTVAVGADANNQLLRRIAAAGSGKFYSVLNPRALPRIFLREVRRVARPLVYEPANPMLPIVESPNHEILRGIESGLPPLSGYVLTTLKENPLVERILRSPQPEKENNSTLLAAWTYGAGKTAALTTDAGARWTKDWTAWDGYDKFFSQIVRWAMRPLGNIGNFAVAAEVRDGKTQVVVSALDADEAYLNGLPISAAAVSPDMQTLPVEIHQTAPGRYVGEFASETPGTYMLVVNTGPGHAPIRTGVNVGYSAEYRDRATNEILLDSLAAIKAGKGPPGRIYRQGLDSTAVEEQGVENPFRHDLPPPVSSQAIWQWMVVAGSCLFWGDVFIRRVHVSLAQLAAPLVRLRDRFGNRSARPPEHETLSRLRSRKAEVGAQLEKRAAAAAEVSQSPELPQLREPAAPKPAIDSPSIEPRPEDARPESYTARLLRAKQKARDGGDRGDETQKT